MARNGGEGVRSVYRWVGKGIDRRRGEGKPLENS